MAKPKLVFHLLIQGGYEAGLIEQTLRSTEYDSTFIYDSMPISDEGYDVLVIEPSMSEWEWLDRLILFRREYPHTPVILYSRDIAVKDDFMPLETEYLVFVAGDITAVKNKMKEIVMRGFEAKKTILLVDDDENTIKSYIRVLRKCPWCITTATSGEAALKRLEEEPVDLIVTDIKMPNVHGLELISRVRETNQDIPIVICSGYPGMKDDEALKFHDIAGFIEKPVDPDVLKKKLETLLT